MQKLSSIKETYMREVPRDTVPQSELVQQLEEFAHNKDKRSEVIKAWTEIKDHPQAEDLKSPVGSAFSPEDLEEDLAAAYDVLNDGDFLYASFEHSLWVKESKKDLLIRVL